MSRKFSEERTRKEMNVPLFAGGIDPQWERAVGICVTIPR
jgi:hypothetical protein